MPDGIPTRSPRPAHGFDTIRGRFAACCHALLLAACAHSADQLYQFTPSTAVRPSDAPGTYEYVEAIRDYGKPRDVPARFQHLVDWHAGMGPVVLLFTAGGRRVCAIPPAEAWRVVVHKPYRCRWSAAH